MIDETTAGPAASSASHCAAKSGGVASPAFSGTGGPKRPRNSRTFASCAASRLGGGSGIHKLSCTAPLEDERNSCIHAAIAVGDISSAPAAPMPPALATAIASEAGLAPAIGASRIGTRSPKPSQNSAARDNGEVIGLMALRFESQRERARLVAALKRPSFIRALRVKQRAAWHACWPTGFEPSADPTFASGRPPRRAVLDTATVTVQASLAALNLYPEHSRFR